MPSEVMQGFNQIDTAAYRKTLGKQSEWIQLSHELLYYYGASSIADLIDFVDQRTSAEIDVKSYLNVLFDAAEGASSRFCDKEKDWLK